MAFRIDEGSDIGVFILFDFFERWSRKHGMDRLFSCGCLPSLGCVLFICWFFVQRIFCVHIVRVPAHINVSGNAERTDTRYFWWRRQHHLPWGRAVSYRGQTIVTLFFIIIDRPCFPVFYLLFLLFQLPAMHFCLLFKIIDLKYQLCDRFFSLDLLCLYFHQTLLSELAFFTLNVASTWVGAPEVDISVNLGLLVNTATSFKFSCFYLFMKNG